MVVTLGVFGLALAAESTANGDRFKEHAEAIGQRLEAVWHVHEEVVASTASSMTASENDSSRRRIGWYAPPAKRGFVSMRSKRKCTAVIGAKAWPRSSRTRRISRSISRASIVV